MENIFETAEIDIGTYSEAVTFVLNSNLDEKGNSFKSPVGYRPAYAVMRTGKKYSVKLSELQFEKTTVYSAWTKMPPGPNRKWSSALFYVVSGLINGKPDVRAKMLHRPECDYNTPQEAQSAFNEMKYDIDLSDFSDWPTIVFYVLVDYRNDAGMMKITLDPIRR